MSEQKQPQPGEWWIADDASIVRIVGVKQSGDVIFESPGGAISNGGDDWEDWHHEPRCDSFDWTESPAIDPGEGWELLPVGTVLQEGDDCLQIEGGWEPTSYPGEAIGSNVWVANTYRRRKPVESHPLMNCQKCGEFLGHGHECTPVESPDDWVEITDPEHIIRQCDQISDYGTQWYNPSSLTNACGKQFHSCGFLRARCRRRDLPDVKPKRIPVRLYWYDGNIVGRYDHSPPTDPSFQELNFDGSGFYVTQGDG